MTMLTGQKFDSGLVKLPEWFRVEVPDMDKIRDMKALFKAGRLHTVCESAHCPNMGTCWKEGVATFMILGGTCTRACRFCSVPAGRPDLVDAEEPQNVALAVKELALRYVVITSVARDDVEDEGAGQFVRTIAAIRSLTPEVKIEVLVPDFSAKEESLKILSAAAPEVIAHNIETVRRLSPRVRPQALHERSLAVLRAFSKLNPGSFVKSSVMLGLGETDEEILEVMKELLATGCRILTIGQYLAPTRTKRHLPVEKFYSPGAFEYWRQKGLEMGFVHVESGPLVRSSYIAERGFQAAQRRTAP
ncbi:MAG: lipoyl synthase [Candidatus Omnitrophica bacterium]|nr:lipoyl synthase [Candidatus Omnitrophota bacterium]MDE2009198.1 lipoyl synthase [Candidatus Omnitrophota bacterium]MDE2213719.1 lipoyl synthase [Candidatus Omnitrophota bacterium]MDE2230706.1 lipoyl synthase [Candidatus Omnitrophota bacterium]